MNMDHDMEKLETCIEKVFESGCATDGVMGELTVFDSANHYFYCPFSSFQYG